MNEILKFFDWKTIAILCTFILLLVAIDSYTRLKKEEQIQNANNKKTKIEIIIKSHEDSLNNIIIERDEEVKQINSISDSAAIELFKKLVSN